MKKILFKLIFYLIILRILIIQNLFKRDYLSISLNSMHYKFIPLVLKFFGAHIGRNVQIESGLNLVNYHTSLFNLNLKDNVSIGRNVLLDLRDKITIDEDVVISMNCDLITHIDLGSSSLSKLYPAKSQPIHIKENSYLGTGVTVLNGVVIGQRSIVGAKSLVKNNIPPNTFVAGIPARKIKDLNAN